MSIKVHVNKARSIGARSPLLYGHFLEHFHRQVYGGVYDPGNPLSDGDGMRTDIIEAMRRIKVPVLRWPGGCFASAYHWEDGVGKDRKPSFDKAWRVEEPNTFGTGEYMKLCRKIGCQPYLCMNAGTGTPEEMSNWVEYCNLESEGRYARQRIADGQREPYRVRYWSVGNENYGSWEIGAKSAQEWGRLTCEAAKMAKHVDPTVQLSAAALPDVEWNINLLKSCGQFLDWISIHEYWDMVPEVNDTASYETCMAYTGNIDHAVREVRGILAALKLEHKIKIAFDEWNLRSWHHPGVLCERQETEREKYLNARDKNDENRTYTMADAVFTACFLNAMNRNCDIVGMANFAPILNTRGCIYSYEDGIVLRSTYHVFDLYVNYMGDTVLDLWPEEMPVMQAQEKNGEAVEVDALDLLATKWAGREKFAVAAVNKHPVKSREISLSIPGAEGNAAIYRLEGRAPDSYNDVGRTEVRIVREDMGSFYDGMKFSIAPHSVNIIQISK